MTFVANSGGSVSAADEVLPSRCNVPKLSQDRFRQAYRPGNSSSKVGILSSHFDDRVTYHTICSDTSIVI